MLRAAISVQFRMPIAMPLNVQPTSGPPLVTPFQGHFFGDVEIVVSSIFSSNQLDRLGRVFPLQFAR